MKSLQPVIWMKGTFLTPQYLQAQDRFIESSLEFQLHALTFRPWGFRTLRIDQEALAAGMFAVSAASGILPDGLLFDIPDSDAAPPVKPIAEAFEQDRNELDVYLAIPDYRERGLNIALANHGADTRFLAEVALLRDENTGMNERPVQVARKNFRILVEGESRQGCSALHAGRVRKTGAGTLQLDPRFVPPLLDMTASEYLVSILRRLVEILSAKSTMLAGTRRQKNLTLADFGTADIANFWLLYTINSHFPLLQHLFEVRRSHPETLYSAMLSLAGSLTTFSTSVHPRELPAYDHDDLSLCFTSLDEKLRFLLDTVVPSNFVSLPLKLVQPHIYATSLAEDRYLSNTRMYLAVSAPINEGELIGRAPHLIKVCSANHIEHLVRQALPGVQMVHTPRPPSAIPVKLNHQYFSLSQTGPAWEAITRARNLAAYVPGDFPEPQLELIILLPQAA
ncbi:MAG: type VI secretion system baseplate subunit TssK [Bryobacteraceae bacterium]|nr:type VI secretion system baseplate subunit TssK [Bryobacterales bacterium]MEB2360137.1 type VI secretion system baseplate subunit TssK [Bryobacterales bacterium]NUN03452.1 type VI secretion system baseplate subunit TssK [Bryobacteraceae bacterium]